MPGSCDSTLNGPRLNLCWMEFVMGLNWVFPSQKLERAERNKPSATQHASVIDVYLANEVFLGRVAGPFRPPPPPQSSNK